MAGLAGDEGAEPVDGEFEGLAFLPEVAPEVAELIEACGQGVDIEFGGIESGFEFRGKEGGGDGSLGKGTDRVGGGKRTAVGVLVDVDEDAASRALGDGALVGDHIGMLGGDHASDDLGKGAELLIGVERLDGEIEVHAGGAGGFEEDVEFETEEGVVEGLGDSDDDGEIGAIGGVEVEEEVVGMIDVGDAAAPGIVVDAAEAGEIEESGAIIGEGVVNFFAAMLGIDGNGVKPVGEAVDVTEIFLEEGLTFDAVRITAENQRAVFEERKNVVGEAVVVGEEVALGIAGLGEIDLVEIGEAETFAVDFENGIFCPAFEEFGLDLGFGGENFADDGRSGDDIGRRDGGLFGGRSGRVLAPGAVLGIDVVAEGEKNGVAKTVFVGPGRIADAGDEFRADPGWFLVGIGNFGKGGAVRMEGFQPGEDFFVGVGVEAGADVSGEAKFCTVVEAEEERAEREAGAPGGGPAADDRVDGVGSLEFEPIGTALADVARVDALGDDTFEAIFLGELE